MTERKIHINDPPSSQALPNCSESTLTHRRAGTIYNAPGGGEFSKLNISHSSEAHTKQDNEIIFVGHPVILIQIDLATPPTFCGLEFAAQYPFMPLQNKEKTFLLKPFIFY